MRGAVIDIGTNTVKLLVADVSGRQMVPVAAKDRTTRLGEGVDDSKRLLPAAMARTIRAIQDFLAEARGLGATDCVAVATSAAREAANRDEFLGQVRHECGLEVELISGEREAELIFRGVSSDPEWSSAAILVVDVGGGSAEFIQGAGGEMEIFRSLPLGALRLTEKFGEGRIAELCEYLRVTLREALAGYRCERMPRDCHGWNDGHVGPNRMRRGRSRDDFAGEIAGAGAEVGGDAAGQTEKGAGAASRAGGHHRRGRRGAPRGDGRAGGERTDRQHSQSAVRCAGCGVSGPACSRCRVSELAPALC